MSRPRTLTQDQVDDILLSTMFKEKPDAIAARHGVDRTTVLYWGRRGIRERKKKRMRAYMAERRAASAA